MTLIGDSGAIYAFYDGSDRYHEPVRALVDEFAGRIVIPSLILAEIDYLLGNFLGVDAEVDFLQDVLSGVYRLHHLDQPALQRCVSLLGQYRDLNLGLADTAVMATAEQLSLYRILTVDERDFRAVRLKSVLTILPADG